MIFLVKPAPSGIRNRTAGSDIGRAPRSIHSAMSIYVAPNDIFNFTFILVYNMETKGFFQLEIILNVLVSSSRLISIPMLWVYCH